MAVRLSLFRPPCGKGCRSLSATLFCCFLVLAGCSNRVSTKDMRLDLAAGQVDVLAAKMELARNEHPEFGTILNLARLQQMQGKWRESIASYEAAIELVEEYERRARINMRQVFAETGSILLSRGSNGYFGSGYERSLMHTFNAVNYLMLGDFAGAAVEMRRMEERQEFWLEESGHRLEQHAQRVAGIREAPMDLNSLPAQYRMAGLLDDPSVRALANSYQDAFSYALSALVCRIADDIAYAEVSMNRARALNDHADELFRSAWAGKKDLRVPKPVASGGETEVLVLVFNGLAPALRVEEVRVPAPYIGYVAFEMPALTRVAEPPRPLIAIDDEAGHVPSYPLLLTQPMAYHNLRDEAVYEMSTAVSRALLRAAASAAVGAAVDSNEKTQGFGGLAAWLTNLGMSYASGLMAETVRNWELLPAAGYMSFTKAPAGSRVTLRLPTGEHAVTLPEDARGCIIVASQYGTGKMRVDHVVY